MQDRIPPSSPDGDEAIAYQRQRYDREAAEYDKHHGDALSQQYRTEFIRERLFGFDLAGKNVLDAMCASGIETSYLLQKNAVVTGLDISTENAAIYVRNWQRPCHVTSIHETGLDSASYDVIYICGGLHHIIPLLPETLREVYRLLKPGGYFVFVEPNKDTWLNALRAAWYKLDSRFHESEQALSYERQLLPFLKLGFKEISVFTGGSIAYLVIGQSLILHTPFRWKKRLYSVLTWVERVFSVLPFAPRLYLAAAWQKT